MRGGARKPRAWAVEMTQKVNAHSGVEVSLWSTVFGFALGTFVWSAQVDSRAELAETTARPMANDAYHARVEKGQEFVAAPGQDTLRQPVHARIAPPRNPGRASASRNPGAVQLTSAQGTT